MQHRHTHSWFPASPIFLGVALSVGLTGCAEDPESESVRTQYAALTDALDACHEATQGCIGEARDSDDRMQELHACREELRHCIAEADPEGAAGSMLNETADDAMDRREDHDHSAQNDDADSDPMDRLRDQQDAVADTLEEQGAPDSDSVTDRIPDEDSVTDRIPEEIEVPETLPEPEDLRDRARERVDRAMGIAGACVGVLDECLDAGEAAQECAEHARGCVDDAKVEMCERHHAACMDNDMPEQACDAILDVCEG